jgi:hypothetical protein
MLICGNSRMGSDSGGGGGEEEEEKEKRGGGDGRFIQKQK